MEWGSYVYRNRLQGFAARKSPIANLGDCFRDGNIRKTGVVLEGVCGYLVYNIRLAIAFYCLRNGKCTRYLFIVDNGDGSSRFTFFLWLNLISSWIVFILSSTSAGLKFSAFDNQFATNKRYFIVLGFGVTNGNVVFANRRLFGGLATDSWWRI